MTDFDKIKNYYDHFDEDNRLKNDCSGKLEYEMTTEILKKYLPQKATILDLGGATGVYAFPLAKMGYKVYLSDLSETLVKKAIQKKEKLHEINIKSIDVINAVDLSIYKENTFDCVLLFGPLYHLLEKAERIKCISEVKRVLKNNGLIFASYIPYLSGSIAILDRYFRHPEQVDNINLEKVFNSGKFNNNSTDGFQEGYYPTTDEIKTLFETMNFETLNIRSIRGFGYEKEGAIYNIKDETFRRKVFDLIEKTSRVPELIETCGHAMYIGKINK